MSDYKNYIDKRSIDLGELATEIGDIQVAIEQYTTALDKLRNHSEKTPRSSLFCQ